MPKSKARRKMRQKLRPDSKYQHSQTGEFRTTYSVESSKQIPAETLMELQPNVFLTKMLLVVMLSWPLIQSFTSIVQDDNVFQEQTSREHFGVLCRVQGQLLIFEGVDRLLLTFLWLFFRWSLPALLPVGDFGSWTAFRRGFLREFSSGCLCSM